MDKKDRLELFKTEYYFQIDMKEKLYTRLTMYLVLVTASITANVTIFDKFKNNIDLKITLIILGVIVVIALGSILYGLYCISHYKTDLWMNSPSDLESFLTSAEQHYRNNAVNFTESDVEEYVSEQFVIALIDRYASVTTVNRDNNLYRQRWLANIATCTYILLLEAGCFGILYLTHA